MAVHAHKPDRWVRRMLRRYIWTQIGIMLFVLAVLASDALWRMFWKVTP